MVDITLIFPYFNDDSSIFKFPPLGIGYIAANLRENGFSVNVVDCTFLTEEEVVAKAKAGNPRVIGIYSMLSMKDAAIHLARRLKDACELLIVGGPLPTTSPQAFLGPFDYVVLGEAEDTVLELMKTIDRGSDLTTVPGLAYLKDGLGMVALTGPRRPRYDLDSLPFPARELYDHNAYKSYYQAHHGYTITSMITSRGCPFDCDFCSRPIFGRTFRSRSPKNIVDEMEVIAGYGYERIWLADDIFPLNRKIGLAVCDEIVKRGLDIEWECLCRADIMDYELARRMRRAGCVRVFFGLESGNDRVLRLMNKRLTVEKSRRAVHAVDAAGIRAGAFFILGYPGETNETMLDTIRFASSLPLDYFSFTIPYPIPGTGLYEKLKGRIIVDEWRKPRRGRYKHRLIYKSEFSPWKLRFGITKAHLQARMRRRLGSGYRLVGPVFEKATDLIFRAMR